MKEMVRYGIILSFICMVSSGLLAGVDSLTKEKIVQQARAEEEASLKAVMPQAESFSPVKEQDKVIYYKALDKQGKIIGVVFKASGKGYSSVIETMVGMLNNGTINAIKILSQNETPGLGSKVTEQQFCSQFSDQRDLNNVQAITGATISSRAVIDSVREKTAEIRNMINK